MSAPVAAELDETWLEMEARLGFGFSHRGLSQSQLVLEPGAEYSLTTQSSLSVSARLRADGTEDLEPGVPARSTYARQSRPQKLGTIGTAELRDLYLDTKVGRAHLRLGKQQVVWGKLDGFKILDAVNPQSFREFILEDFEDSRIGLWTVNTEVALGNVTAQLIWVPDPTVHELPNDGAMFAFRAPRFRFGTPRDVKSPADIEIDRPDDALDDGTVGGRLYGFSAGWDWSVVAMSGLDAVPLGSLALRDGKLHLTQHYRRRELFGGSFARTLGGVAIRGEAAIQPERRFNTRDAVGRLDVVRHDNVSAALGADIDAPATVFINTQVLVDHIFNPAGMLTRPGTDWLYTLFARRTFLYETLFADVRWYTSLSDGDGVIRPSLRYLVGDDTTVGIELDVFYGRRDGIFGEFGDSDRVTMSLNMTF